MAKKKSVTGAEITQHTSTSEAVKIRPRKRLKMTTTTTEPIKIQKIEEKENVPNVLRPLPLANLDELFTIWSADKRIPTVESRREWAAARNVSPQDVHRFFSRQKALLKKSRKGCPKGTYTLPVGIPPVIKQEEEAPRSKPPRKVVRSDIKAEKLDISLNTDDSHAPTSDTLVASPQQKPKDVLQQSRNSSPLPPSSPLVPSSPASDSNATSTLLFSPALPHRSRDTQDDSEHSWCQGRSSSPETSFTCALCTSELDIQPNTSTTGPLPTTDHPNTQFSPDSLFMELSAIPFLQRSPDLMRRRSAIPDSTQWFFDLHFDQRQEAHVDWDFEEGTRSCW